MANHAFSCRVCVPLPRHTPCGLSGRGGPAPEHGAAISALHHASRARSGARERSEHEIPQCRSVETSRIARRHTRVRHRCGDRGGCRGRRRLWRQLGELVIDRIDLERRTGNGVSQLRPVHAPARRRGERPDRGRKRHRAPSASDGIPKRPDANLRAARPDAAGPDGLREHTEGHHLRVQPEQQPPVPGDAAQVRAVHAYQRLQHARPDLQQHRDRHEHHPGFVPRSVRRNQPQRPDLPEGQHRLPVDPAERRLRVPRWRDGDRRHRR